MTKAEQDRIELTKALQHFVRKAERDGRAVYMAIDPGTTGAIGFVCGKFAAVMDIPIRDIAMRRPIKTTAKERRAMARAGKRIAKTKTVDRIKKVCDYDATAEMLRILNPIKERLRVLLEEGQVQNRNKFGGKGNVEAGSNTTLTAYRVGVNYGMWPLYLASRGWDREEVTPLKWKAAMMLLKQDKKVSLSKARAAFPHLAVTALARASDHNRAEALLLAKYHRHIREGTPCK